MMKKLIFIFFVAINSLVSQNDPMKPYVELWQNEQVDSIKKILPQLNQKFPDKVDVKFFNAVFESDAAKAAAVYESIVADFPQYVFADEALYRLIQLAYARGTYQNAKNKFDQLKKNYPKSKWISAVAQMFSDLKIDDTSDQTTTTGSKKFTLQVGAFSMRDNADDLKTKLSGFGYTPIEISEKTVNGKKLFAVWVGSFATKEEAAKTGQTLKSQQKIDFSIVEHP